MGAVEPNKPDDYPYIYLHPGEKIIPLYTCDEGHRAFAGRITDMKIVGTKGKPYQIELTLNEVIKRSFLQRIKIWFKKVFGGYNGYY